MYDADAFQSSVQVMWIGGQLPLRAKGQAAGEIRRGDRRLRCGANDDGGAVISRKFVQRGDAGAQHMAGNGLRLVENDHGAGEIVQAAAA